MADMRNVVWIDLPNATPEEAEAQKAVHAAMATLMFVIGALLLLCAAVVPKPDTSDRPWESAWHWQVNPDHIAHVGHREQIGTAPPAPDLSRPASANC